MKAIITGYYDAYYELGLNMDHYHYKGFLREIENVISDNESASFASLKDLPRRKLLGALVKADPNYSDFISEQQNNIATSLFHTLSGEINTSEFFYYFYTCLGEYYQAEIDRAFDRARAIKEEKLNLRLNKPTRTNLMQAYG